MELKRGNGKALLFLILLFPIATYVLIQSGTNHFKHLPYYGPKFLKGTFHFQKGKKIADTLFYKTKDIQLLDQDNRIFQFKEFDSVTISVVHFFYTRCTSSCPNVMPRMDSIMRQFRIHDNIKFLSVTVDPLFDNPNRLKEFALKIDKDSTQRWRFLTGDKSQIWDWARNSLFINITQSNDSSISCSPWIILIDPSHHIRGYYDGTRESDIKKLRDEIIVLRYEVMRKERELEDGIK